MAGMWRVPIVTVIGSGYPAVMRSATSVRNTPQSTPLLCVRLGARSRMNRQHRGKRKAHSVAESQILQVNTKGNNQTSDNAATRSVHTTKTSKRPRLPPLADLRKRRRINNSLLILAGVCTNPTAKQWHLPMHPQKVTHSVMEPFYML